MLKKSSAVVLNPEDVASHPRPGMAIPGSLTFSSDDQWIAYLYSSDKSLTRQLYVFNPKTGKHHLAYTTGGEGETEETLSAEEKLRRERTRTRNLGVTSYAWIPHSQRIMIPQNGNLYILDDIGMNPRKLVSRGDHPMLDPQSSPDGASIAFVRDAELYVVEVNNGNQFQLSSGAHEKTKIHGLAEYMAQEEMGRQHGFWWSSDSQRIAFTEVDERHIPIYRIVHQGKDMIGDQAQEDHQYPFAGQSNAKVRLGVIQVQGGDQVWMELGSDRDTYLARVQWWPDGSLVAQVENRTQTSLQLFRCNPSTGNSQILLTEINPVWINLHSMLKPLQDGRFIWASERTGFMHLYLFDPHGNMLHPLTSGPWQVEAIVGVNEDAGQVYFLGNRDSVHERHLYAVSLSGKHLQLLTAVPGYHAVQLDHAKKYFIDAFSTPEQPPHITLNKLEDGTVLGEFYTQDSNTFISGELHAPEYIEISTIEGVTLQGMLYRPPASFGTGPYPTIVNVYGGPHAQQVNRSWSATVDLRAQYLASLGYLVMKMDNRGSARRGQAFEGAIKHNMGDIEVQDQVTGVKWLITQGLADPSRVGIYGWSYGGYMALMCLCLAPQVFSVAVAGAPVTHWDGYDTHYTERYMGNPDTNSHGYDKSSVMAHVESIQGKLLLVHGLIDENVHFRHTARLVNALIRAGKPYDLLLFPDERHMPRRLEDRVYLETRIGDFFLAHL